MQSKEIIYYTYTSKKPEDMKFCVREWIRKSDLPIIYLSDDRIMDSPIEKNIIVTDSMPDFYQRYPSFAGMFKKILIGLEASEADYCFMAEDDVLYHPTHWDFTPPTNDKFYYNENVWHLRTTDGFAISYTAKRLSQMCGERKFLIQHFKKRMEIIESLGKAVSFQKMGFEPGTHNRKERVDDYKAGEWRSRSPSIDIKTGLNATEARWSPSKFRNPDNCRDWKEADVWSIPGWSRYDFSFM